MYGKTPFFSCDIVAHYLLTLEVSSSCVTHHCR